MKSAFLFSPKAKLKMLKQLSEIFDEITSNGYQHTINFILDINPASIYQQIETDSTKTLYHDVEKAIKAADVCIFETTIPSLGLGHLIYMAMSQGKPVVVLYQGDKIPIMLSDLEDSKVQVISYTAETFKETLKRALDFAKDQADTRFNFFISPRHSSYLDWIAKNKRIPRSVYLRNLIKSDMENNTDYA